MNTYLVTDLVDIYDATEGSDDYGDPTDNGALVASGVAASMLERSDTTRRPQDSVESTTRVYAGIVPNGTNVGVGYRIVSQTDGATYQVDHVKHTNGALSMPKRLRCRLIDQ